MADSRNKDHRPGEPLPDWQDWYRRFMPTAAAPGKAMGGLDAAWRAAMDSWWDSVAAATPPVGRELLKPAVDQGKAFIALANGVWRSPAGEAGDNVLWRQPLHLWEQAASSVLAAEPHHRERSADASDEALRTYQRALQDYADALRDVSARSLADVAHSWRKHRPSAEPRAGLRELFDLYVELGEHRYHELVSSEAFAVIGGRLINSLVECVHQGLAPATVAGHDDSAATPADAPTAQSEPAQIPDFPELLADLGFGLEQTLTELQAFGEKLNVGAATLRNLGAIDVGMTAKQAVHHDGKLTLYRYLPDTAPANPVPILIVYALANRPYMMDLQPQRSLIRGLMDRGLEVYLIDWGYPDADDTGLGLDDYIDGFLDGCVESLRDRLGLDRINLLGVCQGGTFSLCYSALNADKIHNLVLMVTPVDFHTPDNLLATWLRHVDVDALVDVLGNVPGELLNWAFVSMKPLRLTGQKYLNMLDLLADEEKARTFLRMEKWIHDSPAQAGECFRQFTKDLYQQNKLVDGSLHIGDRIVDLQRISMPVLNVYATQDHIVPPDGTLALKKHISTSDYTTIAFEGGHIGIYVSARAQREVPQKIADWLHARCRTQSEQSP